MSVALVKAVLWSAQNKNLHLPEKLFPHVINQNDYSIYEFEQYIYEHKSNSINL